MIFFTFGISDPPGGGGGGGGGGRVVGGVGGGGGGGGYSASCEKRWYAPEWGVLGGTQGVLFSDGGY